MFLNSSGVLRAIPNTVVLSPFLLCPLAHPHDTLKCLLAEARESTRRRSHQTRCGCALLSTLPCLQHGYLSVLQRLPSKLLKALRHSEMHFKLRSHHGLWLWGGQWCTQGFSLGFKLESVCLASIGVQGSAWAGQMISSPCITHGPATAFLGTSCTPVQWFSHSSSCNKLIKTLSDTLEKWVYGK